MKGVAGVLVVAAVALTGAPADASVGPRVPGSGYFVDVAPGAFYDEAVGIVYETGVTAGCNQGFFCPTQPVTRADMGVFLSRVVVDIGLYEIGASFGHNIFQDVPTGAYFDDEVGDLYYHGVTSGCVAPQTTSSGAIVNEGYFCPDAPVTRGEMAVFLGRVITGTLAYPSATYDGHDVFDDVGSGAFYDGAVADIQAYQITVGCGGSQYCPGALVTRGEMAVFLARLLALLPGAPRPPE